MAIGLGTLGDYTPSSGNAVQGGSGYGGPFYGGAAPAAVVTLAPAAASQLDLSLLRTGPAPSSANGGCGDEPARKQVGPISVYVDSAKGKAWQDCMDRWHAANVAKARAAIDAAADCGPEPVFVINTNNGQKIYRGQDDFGGDNVGAYWAACRSRKIQTAQTSSPPIVPGQTTAVPSTLTTPSSSATGSPAASPAAVAAMTPVGPALALALGPTPSSAAVAAAAPAAVASSSPSTSETAALVVGGGVVLAGLAWLLLRR